MLHTCLPNDITSKMGFVPFAYDQPFLRWTQFKYANCQPTWIRITEKINYAYFCMLYNKAPSLHKKTTPKRLGSEQHVPLKKVLIALPCSGAVFLKVGGSAPLWALERIRGAVATSS